MRDSILSGSGLLFAALLLQPVSLQRETWVEFLIATAAWIIVPWGLKRFLSTPIASWQWIMPTLLSIAFALPAQWSNGILALPWLGWSLWLVARHSRFNRPATTFFSTALLFWAVAAAWAVAHVSAWHAFGFPPIIVLLTAAHFHYAGFALMLITALAYRRFPSLRLKLLGYFIVGSTAAVALAISAARFIKSAEIEAIPGIAMAAAGAGVAIFHMRKAAGQNQLTAWCWRVGSTLLLFGMLLAATYAMRSFAILPSLSIPKMYAWHGSLNALALLLILIGWTLNKKGQNENF